MATYWLTFRLQDDSTYSERYSALEEAVRTNASEWWFEASSFYLFTSELEVGELASEIKSAIRPSTDVAVLGMTEFKEMRVIGHNTDNDIYKIVPFAKKS